MNTSTYPTDVTDVTDVTDEEWALVARYLTLLPVGEQQAQGWRARTSSGGRGGEAQAWSMSRTDKDATLAAGTPQSQ